jgi:hypothetical protein
MKMSEAVLNDNFSNVQLELLKLYSTDISDSELEEVKQKLADFFAKKVTDEADKLWDEKNMDNNLMTKWLDD